MNIHIDLIKKWLFKEWWKELKYIKGPPKESSISLAIGVFIGFTPTIGFQTILCYGISKLFRKSFLISFIGSSLVTGIPLLIPGLYYFEYRVGCYLLKTPPFPRFHTATLRFLLSLGRPIILGSLLSAITGGILSYIIAYVILKIFKKGEI